MISLLASSSEDLISGLVWLAVSGVVNVLITLRREDFLLPFPPVSIQSVFPREQVEGPTDAPSPSAP